MSIFDFFRRKPSASIALSAPEPPKPPARRSDGWANEASGFGTSRDKGQAGNFLADYTLDAMTLSSMYYGDDMASTIVDAILSESFRRGFCLQSKDDHEGAEELLEYAENTHNLSGRLLDAATWARLFGGSILIIGADDGLPLDQPLNEKGIKSVDWFLCVDSRYAQPSTYYSKLGPKLGETESYQVSVVNGTSTLMQRVHETRCVRFGGVPVDPERRRVLRGWGQSVLQRPYDVLRSHGTAMQGITTMLADASQGVYTIKGLIDMLSVDGGKALRERMAMMDYGRSTMRSIVLDEGETFTKVASSFAGIPEIIDRLHQRTSAAADVPVSILFGRSAAGMNATGDLDLESWRVQVGSYQKNELTSKVKRVAHVLSLAKKGPLKGIPLEDLCVEWHPLTLQTDKEKAEVGKVRAETAAIYVQAAIYEPLEMAIALAGTEGTPDVDVDELRAELEQQATFEDPAKPPTVEQPPPPAPEASAEAEGAPDAEAD